MSLIVPNQTLARPGDDLFRLIGDAPSFNENPKGIIGTAMHVQNNVPMPRLLPPGTIADMFVGKIVAPPGGGSYELTGGNYYLQRQMVIGDSSTPPHPTTAQEVAASYKQTVIALNLANPGTHDLPEDGSITVMVYGFDSRNSKIPQLYVFDKLLEQPEFDAIITGSAAMDRANAWLYTLVRAKPGALGIWVADPDYDGTTYTGWNDSENINSDSGQQGNGITLGTGITILAAPNGLKRRVRSFNDCNGMAVVSFEYENGTDLTCSDG